MQLTVLQRSKRAPLVGDVFAFRAADGAYRFGRVVSTGAVVGPTHGCVLVYLYAAQSNAKTRVPALKRDGLLLAPMMTTRAPWSHGYFEHIKTATVRTQDILPQHAFRDARGMLVDDEGRPLEKASAPVGEVRLWDVAGIDAAIAAALSAVTI
jgi:hypothetical protein